VTDVHGNAIYFSRWPIPYDRDQKAPVSRYKHIGLYAYRAEALRLFHSLKPSSLELAENLEQLRYLENGVPIHVALTHSNTVGVDTQSDLVRVRGLLAGKSPL
jgi:3-deoxy-manno-octulosonate cytidylyltransferase (CMP-KDO synthetase)